jgi:pantoate--beta-alanine ligase
MKLFMLAQPTQALFGWKDAQQFLVLRRMVRDLSVPIEMIGIETVRESDGLALSSRNTYLKPEERADAPLIYKGLQAARAAFEQGERDAKKLEAVVRQALEQSPRFQVEYAEARSMETLDRLEQAEPNNTLLAVAARLGATRLIDNIRF